MLDVLQYNLGWPGPLSFLPKIGKFDDFYNKLRTFATYFLEVTILDEQFIGIQPSFIAAAAYYVACIVIRRSRVSALRCSGYTPIELETVVDRILERAKDPETHHPCVYNKYKGKQRYFASEISRGIIKSKALERPEYTALTKADARMSTYTSPLRNWLSTEFNHALVL
jgi:G2/mitotic-specific cyclin 3/4